MNGRTRSRVGFCGLWSLLLGIAGIAGGAGCGSEVATGDALSDDGVELAAITPPASLVKLLSTKPYVEDRCVSATYPDLALRGAAARTYTSGPLTTSVTVANPSAARAAAWIVDSATEIPRLSATRQSASRV
ncbi:MAG: hypothetical protein U0787_11990 [Polyangia bacterium]